MRPRRSVALQPAIGTLSVEGRALSRPRDPAKFAMMPGAFSMSLRGARAASDAAISELDKAMRHEKHYSRLDGIEVEFQVRLIEELRFIAGGRVPKDELRATYLFQRCFRAAVTQRSTPEAEWMHKTEREILRLRKKLGEDVPGAALELVEEFKEKLKRDMQEKDNRHGDFWAAAARQMLRSTAPEWQTDS